MRQVLTPIFLILLAAVLWRVLPYHAPIRASRRHSRPRSETTSATPLADRCASGTTPST